MRPRVGGAASPTNGGDNAAFTEFASVATPRLFRTAMLLCGEWHLAEDLVQTTLAKLYVSWSKVMLSRRTPVRQAP